MAPCHSSVADQVAFTMFLTVPAAFMGDERTGVGGRDSAR